MKDKVLKLLDDGLCSDEVVEKLFNSECIAYELSENFPSHCHEDADCRECWKLRIEEY